MKNLSSANFATISPDSSAHRALHRLLTTAFTDERRATEAVNGALRAARLRNLPDGDDLLDFVRAHVVPRIKGVVAPKMIDALLDDLQAEIDHLKVARGDNTSVSRMGVATRMPARTANSEKVLTVPGIGLRAPAVPRDLMTPPSTRTTPPSTRRLDTHAVPRPAVILFDPDRFGRASLARALVQGRCDVRVLDSQADVIAAVEGPDELHAAVLEIAGIDVEPILRAIASRRPGLPVLVWTNSPRAIVEHVLTTAGIRRFEVAPKSSVNTDVLDLLRRLVSG